MKRSIRLLIVGLATIALPAFPQVSKPLVPVKTLVKSPADTNTELQIICLFRSVPSNTLHGSLIETDEKLRGLLGKLRFPSLFGGEWGETVLLTPPAGTFGAKHLLIIGLGDSETFTPERMYLAGKIALHEASWLGVAHPFFAPTVLDGGVEKFNTGDVAKQVVRGVEDAAATENLLHQQGAAPALAVADVTFLAGAAHVKDTQTAIDAVLKSASR